MGKTQKKRAMRRHNPVRVPDSHLQHGLAIAAASTSETKKKQVVPVIEKLGSNDVQERIWACAAVSNLIQNDSSTRRLLQGKNIVGILISCLSDEVEEVVVEAAGALRNLCIDGGYEICAEMFNKGILEPLKGFIPKISGILTQLFTNPKGSSDSTRFVYEFAENTITLFWCLSETSNKALNSVNQLNLIPFLMAFLDPQARNKFPITTLTAVAQCLYVLTEENPPVSDEIRMNAAYINSLLGIARGDVEKSVKSNTVRQDTVRVSSDVKMVSLRTLVCGILRNIQPLPSLFPASYLDIDRSIILPFLLPLLSLDLTKSVSEVQRLLMMQEQDDINKKLPTLKNGAKSDHKSQADVDLERTEAELRVVKLALELITGICAELPEPEEGDLNGELDEDEEEIEEEWESDEDDNGMKMEEDTATTNDPSSNATGEIAKATKSIDLLSSIVPSCLRFIQPTGLSYPPSFQPSPHPPITSALCGVHIAALECLNNICLSIAELGRDSSNIRSDTSTQIIIEVWTSVWGMLATLGPPDMSGIGSGPQQRMQVWNISLSVLWAVARILKGDPNIVPDEDKVKVLMEIGNGTKDEELIVMCLGILECMAVNPSPTSVPANKVISEYILSFLPASGRPVMVEAVIQAGSSMIDIFSDEAMLWDINFRQGKWELVLKASVDGFRKAVRSIDKRKEGGRDLRRRGDEVLENLIAFVKYRRSLKF